MHRYQSGATLAGHYTVTGLLGSGGSSCVYRARDTLMNRTVAIKVLERDASRLSSVGFMTEARAAALLSHPNIVNVYDILETPAENYIVMEYVCGLPLDAYLRYHGHLSVKESVFATRQVLCALHAAHSRGIVHRDVKPGNMLLTTEGRIKMTDFGIARLPGKDSFLMPDRTVGTVHYVSPEQASGKGVDERSDLYSLGVVMYELLTGRRPFVAERPADIAMLHLTKKPDPPTYYNPEIPKELDKIVLCALEKDPAARFDSAAEMIRVLDKLPDSALSGRVRPMGEGASEYRRLAELHDSVTDRLPPLFETRRHLPEKGAPKGKIELIDDLKNTPAAEPLGKEPEKKPARPLYDFSREAGMPEPHKEIPARDLALPRSNHDVLHSFSAEDTVDIMLTPRTAESRPAVGEAPPEWEDELPFFKRRPTSLSAAITEETERVAPPEEEVSEAVTLPAQKEKRRPFPLFGRKEKKAVWPKSAEEEPTPEPNDLAKKPEKPEKATKKEKSKNPLLAFIGDHFYGVFAALAALLLVIALLSSVLGKEEAPPPAETSAAARLENADAL